MQLQTENPGGVYLLDKPEGWTSFDLTNFVKKISGIKAGHAGTLDPLATGLMIVCTGRLTKKIDFFQGLPKIYSGTFCLGATTASYDRETEEENHTDTDHLSAEIIEQFADRLEGTYEQTAPIFSAKKIGGKRAYKMARAGLNVEVKSHTVTVEKLRICGFRRDSGKVFIDFEVYCSKGTYIRSIARDLGILAETGAYLYSLRRTGIGPYRVANGLSIEDLRNLYPKPQKST
ncbi:MAG: tRNA pseudouridine(55) synthase TruB [Bacteroidota bacterium]|jgi:tRNA pseudouridine55 synthase